MVFDLKSCKFVQKNVKLGDLYRDLPLIHIGVDKLCYGHLKNLSICLATTFSSNFENAQSNEIGL